jgi:hypothetical protein
VVLGPEQAVEVAGNFLLFILMRDCQALRCLEDLDVLLPLPVVGLEVEQFGVGLIDFYVCQPGPLACSNSFQGKEIQINLL